MIDHFEMLKSFIKNQVEIAESELTDFIQQCQLVEFPKGTLIMKAGEPQYCLYFITRGLVKNYISLETGETKIYNFRIENMQVTGYALYNYNDNLKALVNVMCVEDCTMIKVPLTAIKYVVENIKNGERLGRFMAEYHVIEMMNYIIERDTKSIIERYTNLEKKYPNIHNRLPQRMIASYLGITPVHLSNLKKSRKNSI